MPSYILMEIPSFPGYWASSEGEIYSPDRYVNCANGKKRLVRGRRLKGHVTKRPGYVLVEIEGKKLLGHRLIASAFHGEPEAGFVCNHIDGVKTNNAPRNLEWCTHADNLRHAYRLGSKKAPLAGKFGSKNRFSKPVIGRSIDGREQRSYESANLASKDGFHSSGISRNCRGLISSHKGFIWSYG